jgi:hypothetical protein
MLKGTLNLCLQLYLTMTVQFLYTFGKGYGPVQGVDYFRNIPVLLISIGLKPYIHKEFDSCSCFLFY